MFQQFYDPHPALKGFVNNIMVHHVFSKTEPNQNFSIPPFPEHCLIFYVKDNPDAEDTATNKRENLPTSIIVGPNTNRHIMTPGQNHLMFKVGFQPGGLYRLLGIPMTELLCKDSFNSADLLGNEMNEVNDKLKHAVDFIDMKIIIENFLAKRIIKLKQTLPIDQVLPLVIQARGLIKIDRLASSACLSIRQFERIFQQRIGLSPKHYSRLVRFSQAWIMKGQKPEVSWVKIAYECGYFDQMHLIRDFQEFAGLNPSVIESELLQSPAKFFHRLFT